MFERIEAVRVVRWPRWREQLDTTTPMGRKVRADFMEQRQMGKGGQGGGLARARESAVARGIHVQPARVPIG